MYRLFALLAVLLILSGVLLIAVPREAAQTSDAGPRSLSPNSKSVVQTSSGLASYLSTARSVAEQANAPLSILMGLVSLYYTRRTYINSKRLADGKPQG